MNNGYQIIKAILEDAPEIPGIYQMISQDGIIIYIGKAKNLKKRLQNYTGNNLSFRTLGMVRNISKIEYITTKNEAEALLLESRLIKKHQPKYNVLLKDDKSFPYIKVRTDHDFPQLGKHRGKISDTDNFFGPFTSAAEVNKALKFIQKTFKLRNCTDTYFTARKRPCLQYQINRCSAPCVGKISKEEYAKSVKEAITFLKGGSQELQNILAVQMEEFSRNMEYEKAAEIRDKIKNLSYIQLNSDNVTENIGDLDVIAAEESFGSFSVCIGFYRAGGYYGHKLYFPVAAEGAELKEVLSYFIGMFYQNTPCPKEIIVNTLFDDVDILVEALYQLHNIRTKIHLPIKGIKKSLIEIAQSKAEEGLKQKLKHESINTKNLEEIKKLFHLNAAPERIEIYDNSHIMGSHAVGAMVVATPSGFNKKEYRSYNVENKSGDDYGILKEVMTRRIKKILEDTTKKPDLMIIDGGKGQLSTAMKVMENLGIHINMVSMSKGLDRNAGREIFHLQSGEEFTLDKNNDVMKYLQILRDEAHNFAISKHRNKRSKAMYFSSLDNMEGVGEVRKRALLNYFGSIEKVKEASIDELCKVKSISKALAQKIVLSYQK